MMTDPSFSENLGMMPRIRSSMSPLPDLPGKELPCEFDYLGQNQLRATSPSLSMSPEPALGACPALSRSFSSNSSSDYGSSSAVSTISRSSTILTQSSAPSARPTRGYVRTQGVAFAPSAGNRDSVLCLGSIAHLQYYFARTGLLDGKGAQLAKDSRGKPGAGSRLNHNRSNDTISELDVESPITAFLADGTSSAAESIMLPPTVSTYSHRKPHIAPPPDARTLQRDLVQALEDTTKALSQVAQQQTEETQQDHEQGIASIHDGWNKIQGVHVLDVVTLAIRAARLYYTSHEKPARLYSIRSQRQLREDLMIVLESLKRMASRNFSGGIRDDEMRTLSSWVNGIGELLIQETRLERQETEEQQKRNWNWMHEPLAHTASPIDQRARELDFLNSFLPSSEILPAWDIIDPVSYNKTPTILSRLCTGLTLVQLHNSMVKSSCRPYGEITTYHTDTSKPYRCAENLRFWLKAAEIRWEVKLVGLDVMGIVYEQVDAMVLFDRAVLDWARAVREELMSGML